MDFETFLWQWSAYYRKYPHIRLGQALMNKLDDVKPNLYQAIVKENKNFDCFYDDNILPMTLGYLGDHWND